MSANFAFVTASAANFASVTAKSAKSAVSIEPAGKVRLLVTVKSVSVVAPVTSNVPPTVTSPSEMISAANKTPVSSTWNDAGLVNSKEAPFTTPLKVPFTAVTSPPAWKSLATVTRDAVALSVI